MFKKIAKNRLGLFGLIFISLLIFISILGYLITPDSTPQANNIHLEIALQSPGFKVQMMRVPLDVSDDQSTFFGWMLFGKDNIYNFTPIQKA
ncbi:ABC transporter permease, partial [Bacteroidia bacterium]|nr:ABC transporter permease [Bacteroidia bacterium]